MKKHVAPAIIFVAAVLILAMGISQIALYVPPQLAMLDEAGEQGATEEQISEYYWEQLVPQTLGYAIASLGFASVLFAAGAIYIKLNKTVTADNSTETGDTTPLTASGDDEFGDEDSEIEEIEDVNDAGAEN